MLIEVPKYTTTEIRDLVESFAIRPDDHGRYPDNDEILQYRRSLENSSEIVSDDD